ncbi:MAG: sulfatase [Planctomycetaceae bacterium]|nr:sulfatase [Planctomycetaceae bacterium]
MRGHTRRSATAANRFGETLHVKQLLLFLLVVGWSSAPAVRGAEPAARARPNILLICVDDLKPILGCYGDRLTRSPHIDRLAARGILFERAYCNQAVCSPSRNALLTGLRPQTLGIYDLATNFRVAAPQAITLPQYFRQHGYRTASLGKVFHVGHDNHDDPASWSVPSFRPGERAEAPVAAAVAPAPQERKKKSKAKRGPAYSADDVADSEYGDGKVADEAIRRLQAARAAPAEPFFLAVGFVKPHLPFVAPKKYWDLYQRADFELASRRELPAGAPSYAGQKSGELRNYRGIPAEGPLPDDLQRTLIHGYHAATSYTDAQVGRVLAALDETGLAANTIIVFWGDHGWHLGDHGMWCKHTNYEQAARIPLLLVAPGVTAPASRTKAFAESVDIYPTLCELAGVPIPAGLDGSSLLSVARDPRAGGKDSALHVYPRGERIGRAIRTERYRLVEWKVPGSSPDTAEFELYDYENDPLETQNLADTEPETVAQLRALLAKHPEARPQVDRPAEAVAPGS